MPKIYNCKICNYDTDRLFNYKAHLKTKKHISLTTKIVHTRNVLRNGEPILQNGDNVLRNGEHFASFSRKCIYCSKEFTHKKNVKRHQEKCKLQHYVKQQKQNEHKLQVVLEKCNELQQEVAKKEAIIKEKENIQIEKDILSHDLEALKKDYHQLVLQIANDYKKTKNPTVNMFYIMNNFKNAKNFDDLMDPPLTDTEIEELEEINDVLAGSVELIARRCVDNLCVSERPLHCIDTARNKYLLRNSNKWVVDCHGDKILCKTYKKMYGFYMKNIEGFNEANIDDVIKNQQQMLKLGARKNQLKIIKDLNTRLDVKSIDVDKIQ